MCVAVIGCTAAGIASGQTAVPQARKEEDGPLDISISQDVTYDTNPYRLGDGVAPPGRTDASERSDWISITGLRIDYDRDFDGHRLGFVVAPSLVRYARFDQLDHTRQRYDLSWSVRPLQRAEIGLRYQHLDYLADLADQRTREKNMVTADTLGLDTVFGTGARWQLVGGANAARYRNESELQKAGDRDGWEANLGVRQQSRAGNWVDLRGRYGDYRFPNRAASILSDSGYEQQAVEFGWNWAFAGHSRLSGKFGYQWREHDTYDIRDFKGWYGNASYLWRSGGASAVRVDIYRQIGEVTDASASYAKTTGIRAVYDWSSGPKLTLSPSLDWRWRDYLGVGTLSRGNEDTLTARLSVNYQIRPSLRLTGGVGNESRRADQSQSAYSATFVNALLNWQVY